MINRQVVGDLVPSGLVGHKDVIDRFNPCVVIQLPKGTAVSFRSGSMHGILESQVP